MKTYLFILSFLFIYSNSFSQLPARSSGQVVSGSNVSVFFNNPNFSYLSSETKEDVIKYENIEGSPYIDNYSGASNTIPIGKFYSPQMEYIETALARYNAYTDEMEVSLLEDGVDYYLLKKEEGFLYIVLGEKTYRAYLYNNKPGFYVILSPDDTRKCVLLKKERIVFEKERKASSTFVSGTPDSFKRIRDVYYFKIDETLIEVPKKKKIFYNIFRERKNEVKKFVESNRLKINKEEDLIKISEYFNSLK